MSIFGRSKFLKMDLEFFLTTYMNSCCVWTLISSYDWWAGCISALILLKHLMISFLVAGYSCCVNRGRSIHRRPRLQVETGSAFLPSVLVCVSVIQILLYSNKHFLINIMFLDNALICIDFVFVNILVIFMISYLYLLMTGMWSCDRNTWTTYWLLGKEVRIELGSLYMFTSWYSWLTPPLL